MAGHMTRGFTACDRETAKMVRGVCAMRSGAGERHEMVKGS